MSLLGARLPTDEFGRIIDSPRLDKKAPVAREAPAGPHGPAGVREGDVYGSLTVLERVPRPSRAPAFLSGHSFWRCRCASGYLRIVVAHDLRRARTTRCSEPGCRTCTCRCTSSSYG